MYQVYIRNNKAAMETIEKCKSSETFKNIFVQVLFLGVLALYSISKWNHTVAACVSCSLFTRT